MKFAELRKIVKRLYKFYIKEHLSKILLALLLSFGVAGGTAGIAWLLDPAVKKIFIEKSNTMLFLIPIAIIISFSVKGLSLYFSRMLLIVVSEKIVRKLGTEMASVVLNSDTGVIESKHSGKYISHFLYDVNIIGGMVGTGVLNLMKDSLTLIVLVSLMFYQNWKLAFFALIMMPLAAIVAKSLGKRIGKVTSQSADAAGDLSKILSEIIKASKMIKIYQQEKFEFGKASQMLKKFMEKQIKINSVLIRATPIMEIMTGFIIAGFIYYTGLMVWAGEIEINNFFSFLTAMMLSYQPIRSLASINMLFYQGGVAAKRVFEIIDTNISIKEEEGSPNLKITKSNIDFKNVSFSYPSGNEKAIKDINFSISGGSTTAFVGHSGAGKSTIINLIPRFYDPSDGKIIIDEQSIHDVSLSSLRKNISLVSQDIILFDDTVRANIAYAKIDSTDEEIKKACDFAAAAEFIEKLPQSYETLIGENGVRLSGGQKQRISIARAILKNAPIILLDEATSSLDADSEEKVQNAIINLTKNRTTLVIAHRLSTIIRADKIIIIDKGKLVASGTHNELLKNSSIYKNLYSKQLNSN